MSSLKRKQKHVCVRQTERGSLSLPGISEVQLSVGDREPVRVNIYTLLIPRGLWVAKSSVLSYARSPWLAHQVFVLECRVHLDTAVQLIKAIQIGCMRVFNSKL